MPIDAQGISVLRRHLGILDSIVADAQGDLNAVRGRERVARWKAETVRLLAQYVGPDSAQRFSALTPGPSFTPDLLEELADEAEFYRSHLFSLLPSSDE